MKWTLWAGVWALGLCGACDARSAPQVRGIEQQTNVHHEEEPGGEDLLPEEPFEPPPQLAADSGSASDGADEDEDAGAPAADGGESPIAAFDPALCDVPRGEVARASTTEEFTAQLAGDWHLCGTTSVFFGPPRGITFHSDGTWSEFEGDGRRVFRGQWLPQTNPSGYHFVSFRGEDFAVPSWVSVHADGTQLRIDTDRAIANYVRAGARAMPKVLRSVVAQNACARTPAGRLPADTAEKLETALFGIWYACDPYSPFTALELTRDHGIYELNLQDDGTLARGAGRASFSARPRTNEGSCEFNYDGAQGHSNGFVHVSGDGLQMRVDYSAYGARFARPSVDPQPAQVFVDDVLVAAEPVCARRVDACESSGGAAVEFTSEADFKAALQGRWQTCGSCGDGRAGLEITADGHWYELRADREGKLWRAVEWDHSGIFWTENLNPAGSPDYHVRWMFDGGGYIWNTPRLSGDVSRRTLELDEPLFCSTYVRLPDE